MSRRDRCENGVRTKEETDTNWTSSDKQATSAGPPPIGTAGRGGLEYFRTDVCWGGNMWVRLVANCRIRSAYVSEMVANCTNSSISRRSLASTAKPRIRHEGK